MNINKPKQGIAPPPPNKGDVNLRVAKSWPLLEVWVWYRGS